MKKGIVGIILVIVVAIIWFSKVFSFIETDQYNSRVETSNRVVDVLNDLQSTVASSGLFIDEFIKVNELTESQQRGMWELLKITKVDFDQDIQNAITRLSEITINDNEIEKSLIVKATSMANSYLGYGAVYEQVIKQLLDKTVSPENASNALAIGLYELQVATETAQNDFGQVQTIFLKREN